MNWFYKAKPNYRTLITILAWVFAVAITMLYGALEQTLPMYDANGDVTAIGFIASLIGLACYVPAIFCTVHSVKIRKATKKAERERIISQTLDKEAPLHTRQAAEKKFTPANLGLDIGIKYSSVPTYLPDEQDGTINVTHEYIHLTTEKAISDFRAVNSYVVFDLETTGLSRREHEIIEIAMIKVQNGEIIKRFHSLTKPSKAVSQKITQITGITNKMLENKPSFSQIADDVAAFIGDDVLIAHNAPFDIGFLSTALEPRRIHLKAIDTLHMSRNILRDLENYKLETLITHYGIADEQTHRAMGDADCTYEIFVRLCNEVLARSSTN